ncbi:MAG: hypothetical protein KC636_19745, partial [Myxococcales bacterium]|nr:hypothetical protein [Myxococcales bacterium]
MTRARSWIVGLCLGLLGLGLALGRQGYLDAQARDAAALAAKTPAPRRGDGYVSSDTCVGCHPDTHESWRRSFHRTMTQLATPAAVRAPFDGVTLRAGGRDYKLSREGDTFLVEMPDWEWARAQARRGVDTDAPGYAGELPRRRFQVVMTTGSHHMQTYWVEGSRGNEVYNLPFVYLFADERAGDEGRWLPREEVFLRPPDAPPFRQTWNDNCILCHSTGPQPGLSKDGVDTRVAELGIGCEACHGPGAAHVERHRAPLARYERRLDDVPDDTIVNPARLPPARAAAVCGQCHAKTFINDQRAWLEHGMTFKPGEDLERERTMVLPRSRPEHPWLRASARRDPAFIGQFFWPDGMIRVSGREYNGVVESRCATAGEMTCTSCHSMHRGAPAMQLQPSDAALVDPGDAGCRECHAPLFADVAAHTRHAPDSQGSACVNCHMPYTTYGLLRALRSHLVDSPTVRVSLESGRPNACNLCHL